MTNSTIESNGSAEFYVSSVMIHPNVQIHVNNNTIRDTVNNNRTHSSSLVYAYGNNSWNDDGSGVPIDFRGNYWGGAATDSMNAGSNPRNLNFFYDWHDEPRYLLVNYADYVGATVTTGNTAELSFLDENGNWIDYNHDIVLYAGESLHTYFSCLGPLSAGEHSLQVKFDALKSFSLIFFCIILNLDNVE